MVGEVGEPEEALESEGAIVEEERKPKIARIPVAPTAREWDDHMTHHAEFRDWCPLVFSGKGYFIPAPPGEGGG